MAVGSVRAAFGCENAPTKPILAWPWESYTDSTLKQISSCPLELFCSERGFHYKGFDLFSGELSHLCSNRMGLC